VEEVLVTDGEVEELLVTDGKVEELLVGRVLLVADGEFSEDIMKERIT